jgi:subtilisin family serine protease
MIVFFSLRWALDYGSLIWGGINAMTIQVGRAVGYAVAAGIFLSACASNPDKIAAAYVSPIKYAEYGCTQLGMEMSHVGERTTQLYFKLKKLREGDNVQMGIGLILFWPTLFFLEGGDGPEAAEYAQLKGEFEALRINAVNKGCGINIPSPSEIIEGKKKQEKAEKKKKVSR